jgi:hypothetical protein
MYGSTELEYALSISRKERKQLKVRDLETRVQKNNSNNDTKGDATDVIVRS